MIAVQDFVRYRKGSYSVHDLVTQRVSEDGQLWNYAVVNRSTGIPEALFGTLVQARMAADNLAKITEDLDKPVPEAKQLTLFPGGGVPH